MYRLVKLLAALAYLAAGILGLLLCVRFVLALAGPWGAGAAVLVFPLTLPIVPWAALVRDGTWAPLVVVYGGTFAAGLLHALARALERGARSGRSEAESAAGPTASPADGERGPDGRP